MNQTIKTVLIAAIAAVVVVLIGFALVGNQSGETLGAIGITRFPNSGLTARCLSVSTSTPPSACTDGTFKIGDTGTAISKYICATATWNPANISSSTIPASTTVAIAGLASGNLLFASLDAASSTAEWYLTANVSSSLAFINLVPLPNTAAAVTGLNLGTSTVKACAIQ